MKHFKEGNTSIHESYVSVNTLFSFLSILLWIVLIFYVAKQYKGNLQTDLVSPDALPRPQEIAGCDIIFNLNSNITITTISHSMPRSRAIDERHKLSKAPKSSQMLLFWTPVISSSYDVWWGTHATSPLKTKDNLQHIHFLSHRDAWEKVICSTGKETCFLTDSSQPNRYNYVAHLWEVGRLRLWYANNFS